MARTLKLFAPMALLLALILTLAACSQAQPAEVPDATQPEAAKAVPAAESAPAPTDAAAVTSEDTTREAAEEEAAHTHDEGAHTEADSPVIDAADTLPDDVVEVALTATEGRDWSFEPNVIEVPVGQRVKLTLFNEGRAEHDVEISELMAEHIEAMGGAEHLERLGGGHHHADVVAAHAMPGDTASVMFTPTKPGEYEFACTLPGHKAAGMVGKLIVLPEGAEDGKDGVSDGPAAKISEGEGHHHDLHIEMESPGHWHIFNSKSLTFTVRDDHGEGVAGLSPVFTYQRVGSDRVGTRTLEEGDIVDNGDGTYTVEYAPSETGAYTLSFEAETEEGERFFLAQPVEVVWDGEEGIKRVVDGTDYVYQIRYEWKPGHIHASDTEEATLVFGLMRAIEKGDDINWERPWENRFDFLSSMDATVKVQSGDLSETLDAEYKGKGIYEATRAFPPEEVGHDGREYEVTITFTDPYNGAEVSNGEPFPLKAVAPH